VRIRIGALDLAAVAVVMAVLFIPPRALRIESAYAGVAPESRQELELRLARAQAALSREPGDGAAAQELAEILISPAVKQHDQARRVAGEAASHEGSPTRWRALLALSWTLADRFEIAASLEAAEQAIAACGLTPATCPAHERARIEVYRNELIAGVEAIGRGADPRHDPAGFRRELSKAHPTSTFRAARTR
jgi:hypothetical protein